MNNPLFSVLIANYNNGRFLQEAIDSVLAQTYTNWEIILVDDKSTDNSFEVYDKYKDDSRFHIYYNDENKGCGYTKRRCAELANGEICGFLDPDDALCDRKAIEIMVNYHKNNPDKSLFFSDMYLVDENLKIVERVARKDIQANNTILDTCSWPIGHWVTFSMGKYKQTEGVDAFMERAVDMDLYYKLEEVGGVGYINMPLYSYRVTAQSISMNGNMYKSHVWHSYSCVQAMKRRMIRNERLMLFPVEYDLERIYRNGVLDGEAKIRNTRAYKLGKFIMHPVISIKSIIKKQR